ncbi:hypothetical protein MTX26_18560 [Bradyrhizobium sp. ISRA443]|uniref:hypothetical protein n=1 Tax=unclassified Bradyrhizobium TaxID=2631580 RepID=UPI002478A42C|nr:MULTISPECIES: hypothetical protein [unclassified Bradyrhizobium]WGR92199.1 hypothetical protein MTX20_29225 [Bradyrhizobium sp. ISRA435]WGR96477.1 hypothetical protein MTX23_18560 [Bradyrhizobium sp. ISRA436]WGS03364.1 hypothetical protein MTX18_18560 [Bradyrhizobium sp. ISRA437]WGS10248.1 hypothetical protein MTX26_18560 [Bradyrhizobium sp. ISRA443]
MTLIAAAVRHAITLPPKQAQRVLAQFKTMLPHDLSKLARQSYCSNAAAQPQLNLAVETTRTVFLEM